MTVILDYNILTGLRPHHPTETMVTNTVTEYQLHKKSTQCTLEVETYQVINVAERNEGALRGVREKYELWKTKFME